MIGDRLKIIREEKGLSSAKMATNLGIPAQTYSNYERNERFPDPERLVEIANNLGVSIDYLMGNSGHRLRMEDFFVLREVDEKNVSNLSNLGFDSKVVNSLLNILPSMIEEAAQKYEMADAEYQVGSKERFDLRRIVNSNPGHVDEDIRHKMEIIQQIMARLAKDRRDAKRDLEILEEKYNLLKRIVEISNDSGGGE